MSAPRIGPIRQTWYKWKSLRLPWRKRFLVGLDLQGNTYWVFRLTRENGPDGRWRRIVKYPGSSHLSDVKVPPEWHQWLRYQRESPPSIPEQIAEGARQQRIKLLAAEADRRWEAKERLVDQPTEWSHLPGMPKNEQVEPDTEAGKTQPQEQISGEETRNKSRGKPPPPDPWKPPSGPSETWQPQAWAPTAAKKR